MGQAGKPGPHGISGPTVSSISCFYQKFTFISFNAFLGIEKYSGPY